jgi:hypothetical protein
MSCPKESSWGTWLKIAMMEKSMRWIKQKRIQAVTCLHSRMESFKRSGRVTRVYHHGDSDVSRDKTRREEKRAKPWEEMNART